MNAALEDTGFVCADCNKPIMHLVGDLGTGYAVDANDKNRRYCYLCSHARELQQAQETGHLFAYLAENPNYHVNAQGFATEPRYIVTSWPGISFGAAYVSNRSRSNFGDERWYFTFGLPNQAGGYSRWYGVGYGGPGMYARCHRVKGDPK